MTRRTRLAVVAGLVLSMLATGCANQIDASRPPNAAVAPPAGVPVVHAGWKSCMTETSVAGPESATIDALALPRLDSFAATAVVICSWAPQKRPDGGIDLAATEERADDAAALLSALRLPDEPRIGGSPDELCSADLRLVPWLALLDRQGRWIQPGIPADDCGKVRSEVQTAVDGLETTRVSTRVVRELQSAGSAATGCDDQHADQIWTETSAGLTGGPDDKGPLISESSTAPAYLCTYRVPTAQQHTQKPAGDLLSSIPLGAERWTAIKREIEYAEPAAACTTPANRFAMVPAPELYVELDGCQRVLVTTDAGSALRHATPALLALLTD